MTSSIVFRTYTPEDHPAIADLCQHIWEGNDYLPHLINDFYESDQSHPVVAVLDDRIVAVANMRELNDRILWLEAMRTHPEYRGQGIATELLKLQINRARELGKQAVWLFTGEDNQATRTILDRLQFNETGRYYLWGFERDRDQNNEYPGLNADGKLIDLHYASHHFSTVAQELSEQWLVCNSSETLAEKLAGIDQVAPLLVSEFIAFPPDVYDIKEWLASGSILYLEDRKGIITMCEGKEQEGLVLGITTQDPDVVEAALLYALQSYQPSNILAFFPQQVKHPLLSMDQWLFRLMTLDIRENGHP